MTDVNVDAVEAIGVVDEAKAETVVPEKIKFTRPFGYVDAAGHMHYWMVGQVEDNATNIATVIARGCIDFVVV